MLIFLEIIKTIKHQNKKPKVVIFENVRGFLSSKDEVGKLLTDRLKMEMKKVVIEAEAEIQKQVSERWKSDMTSDSWLSKNVRPMVLIFLV